MLARFLFFSVIALGVAGCAGIGSPKHDSLAISGGQRFPACDAEIKAFVALTRLAKQLGDNWRVFEPALEAMQDQIVNCVDDNYPDPLPI
jgi:hypothetical protein